MIDLLVLVLLLILIVVVGVATYRIAKQKQFAWPKCFGVLAAVFFPFFIMVLSAPAKETRQPIRPMILIIRIIITALLVKVILILGDTFSRSPWLGALYAGTFQLFAGIDSPFFVDGNSIEFSYANVVISGCWSSYAALVASGITLGASFWQLRLNALCWLIISGFILGAVYDYLCRVLWFGQALSLTDVNALSKVPTTYTALLTFMGIILFSVAVLIATKLHNNYKRELVVPRTEDGRSSELSHNL